MIRQKSIKYIFAILCILGVTALFSSFSFALKTQSDLLFLAINGCFLIFNSVLGYYMFRTIHEILVLQSSKSTVKQESASNTTTCVTQNDITLINEVMCYALGTFKNVLQDNELTILKENIINFIQREEIVSTALNRRIINLKTLDIYHFGWNVGKHLKKSNMEIAVFLKSQFLLQLNDCTTETVAKKLSSDDGSFMIPKIPTGLKLTPFPLAKKLGIE